MSSDTLVVLDWGHLGQMPPREMHTGATHGDQIEVYGIAWYLLPLMVSLREAGHSVQIAGQGDYTARQKAAVLAARKFRRVAYISCHLNKFAQDNVPNRCVVFHDARSLGGADLAEMITSHVDEIETRVVESGPDDWTRNAWRVAGGNIIFNGPAGISGVCLAPMSLDGVPAPTAESLQKIGTQIAIGVSQWLDTQ